MTLLRSLLFVPADSETKLAKAESAKADALILDLEDSVAPARKEAARKLAAEFLRTARAAKAFVRINPLAGDDAARDVAAVASAKPYGIVLPKCAGVTDVERLATDLDRAGSDARILPIAGETAAGVLTLHSFAGAKLPRLVGLSWGPFDLAADLGAASHIDGGGTLDHPYRLAMSLTLLAAKAAGVAAIDTVYAQFRDDAGLLAQCQTIRRQGWTGKLAIHPAQVPVIHEGFRPSTEDIAHAERVVQAFASGEGVVSLDGVMLDRPHLAQARYVLALRDAF